MNPPKCTLCQELCKSRKKIAWGEVHCPYPNDEPRVMVILESPGVEEDKAGRPAVGSSGQEARYHLDINGISSKGVWIDNILKCHPPGDRDPHQDEIDNCTTSYLIPTIREILPTHIITMGRISSRFLLGDVDMEMCHGIPRAIQLFEDIPHYECVIIPTYHPAAGMHDPTQMLLFHCDMRTAGGVIRGDIPPYPVEDLYKDREVYTLLTDNMEFPIAPGEYEFVAVDTEWARKSPWCLSFSVRPGESWVVRVDQKYSLETLAIVLGLPTTTTIIHNALYDVPVLAQMGILPFEVWDTMVMAYLLQNEPQGLKPLAFRHCGMIMNNYEDMVGGSTRENALRYLEWITLMEWPNPEPIVEWHKGEPKVRQPQNIGKKVNRILKDVEEKGADPWERWKDMKEGKEEIEEVMGPMPEGELCDIPLEDAVRYSARDADATIRVFPILKARIDELGLMGTFLRDMKVIPMVVDMMENGMPVNIKEFHDLSVYLEGRMSVIQASIQKKVGHLLDGKSANPASYPQMSYLIYDKLKLHEVGGKYRSKKGAVSKSTADDILKRYINIHPVVQEIINWREYQKLNSSYALSIPKKVSPDGRIRTTLRITRTTTGRLSSSKPNLMAQPVRSSEGRKIRDCYETPDGYEFLSGDYSQVEMRVAADGSQDERMMEIFRTGKDIHAQTASWMFGVPLEQLDEMKHRYPAKRVGFGILNLITADGLQRELEVGGAGGWTVADCADMINSWFAIFKGVASYMKSSGEQAKRLGYVKDMWGRIRYIPGIRSQNKWIRLEAERQAGNAPIQMGAQGIIKEAMGRLVGVYRGINSIYPSGIIPLIQIHDDIVWQYYIPILDEVVVAIRTTMETPIPGFSVPIEVDFKRGSRWGSMEKIKRV